MRGLCLNECKSTMPVVDEGRVRKYLKGRLVPPRLERPDGETPPVQMAKPWKLSNEVHGLQLAE